MYLSNKNKISENSNGQPLKNGLVNYRHGEYYIAIKIIILKIMKKHGEFLRRNS